MSLIHMLLTADEVTLYRLVREGVLRAYAPARDGDWSGLLRNMLLLTLATVAPFLVMFLLRRPAALQGGMWAQVGLHGLPIVLLVNLTMAGVYAERLPRFLSDSSRRNLVLLLGDATARLLLTMLLTALSFLLWASLKGAFAGSVASALGALGSSFRFGIRFESLTGVYLYAVGLGALPVFALAFLPTLATQRWCQAPFAALAQLLPVARRPALATLLAFCLVSAVVLTLTDALLGLLPA